MDFLTDLKNKIARELKVSENSFSYPPQAELGDLSLACFELAREQKKSPAQLAITLADVFLSLAEFKKYFSTVKAIGPYLNFFIAPEYLATAVVGSIKKEKNNYGCNQSGQGRKVMIEYSNGNTHKEYHVGHLRNISYGDAVNSLLAANGYKTIPVSYINDFGIHAAKTIWEWRNNPGYQNSQENKGYLLGKCYVAATKKLVEQPEAKEAVGKIMKEIENRSGENYQIWQETREWSIKYFNQIYNELSVKFARIFYENEVIDAGRKIVDDLMAKNILRRSEGAVIADLESYGLGILPIIRSDGTALYPVADLALASEKFKAYDLDESIYVVDVRQSLYFKQLFKILELLGYREKLVHLTYDFVTLPEGMMSSRTGNVVTYEELKNQVKEKLVAETKKRHADWTESRIEQVARNLTVSTIKFEMLKVGAERIITFDINEASKFDGYTACYLQYGYARLKSIIRKEGFTLFAGRPQFRLLSEAKEKSLLLKIAKYPEIVASAGLEYNPSELAKYLFELVQLSNDYYHGVNILKAAPKTRQARLALIKAIAQVLNNGFEILGMKILEEM